MTADQRLAFQEAFKYVMLLSEERAGWWIKFTEQPYRKKIYPKVIEEAMNGRKSLGVCLDLGCGRGDLGVAMSQMAVRGKGKGGKLPFSYALLLDNSYSMLKACYDYLTASGFKNMTMWIPPGEETKEDIFEFIRQYAQKPYRFFLMYYDYTTPFSLPPIFDTLFWLFPDVSSGDSISIRSYLGEISTEEPSDHELIDFIIRGLTNAASLLTHSMRPGARVVYANYTSCSRSKEGGEHVGRLFPHLKLSSLRTIYCPPIREELERSISPYSAGEKPGYFIATLTQK